MPDTRSVRYHVVASPPGEWKAGRQHGQGTYRLGDGDVYVGEWKGGFKEGTGVYRCADGAYFEGEFKADDRDGTGTHHYVDGRAEVGTRPEPSASPAT